MYGVRREWDGFCFMGFSEDAYWVTFGVVLIASNGVGRPWWVYWNDVWAVRCPLGRLGGVVELSGAVVGTF
eukprot:9489153-Pyramimonas_sp.AAC.3